MAFAAHEVTSPNIGQRVLFINFGYLLSEHQVSYRYQPSLIGDWIYEGFMEGKGRDRVTTAILEKNEETHVRKSIDRYLSYLKEPSFQEHWEEYESLYNQATYLFLGTTGDVKVKKFYTWVDPDNPVTSPYVILARHFNIPCINLAEPKSMAKWQDWIMQHTLTF